ncbi:GntR family transcriptional regulator [Alicyclobacillus sp. SO9]|uniref:GntR family transcriptional regulator n=1 Tax=Alicyclobacillus sp. SO9 TaxID=2665646 RepID=UPI0018E77EAA|nr:GntR family transcriptional regulator [Alicyclobacillus sp. SO9]QQE80479.1 GntR family transcriptional regulator [Alicyclobacillus sp. SO9]
MADFVASINPDLPLPLYHQLKNLIMQHIETGEWRPNQAIPTEIELMNRYGVSRTTVREAVSSLVQEGYLVKKQGKGTFVREPRVQERLGKLTGFAEEMTQNGYDPSARLIGVFTDLSEDEDFANLELPEGDAWVKIERLRLASGEPIAVERSYWPKGIADILVQQDLETVAYYSVLEEKGIYLRYAEEDISAVNADTTDAMALKIKLGSSLIEMTRFTYDNSERLIEYTCTRYRGDRYKYHVHLER